MRNFNIILSVNTKNKTVTGGKDDRETVFFYEIREKNVSSSHSFLCFTSASKQVDQGKPEV